MTDLERRVWTHLLSGHPGTAAEIAEALGEDRYDVAAVAAVARAHRIARFDVNEGLKTGRKVYVAMPGAALAFRLGLAAREQE